MVSYCQQSCSRCACLIGGNATTATAGGAPSPSGSPPSQSSPAAQPTAPPSSKPPAPPPPGGPGPASQDALLQPLFSQLGGGAPSGGTSAGAPGAPGDCQTDLLNWVRCGLSRLGGWAALPLCKPQAPLLLSRRLGGSAPRNPPSLPAPEPQCRTHAPHPPASHRPSPSPSRPRSGAPDLTLFLSLAVLTGWQAAHLANSSLAATLLVPNDDAIRAFLQDQAGVGGTAGTRYRRYPAGASVSLACACALLCPCVAAGRQGACPPASQRCPGRLPERPD